jgi:nucleotide-binding universal stress UspA family protein
MDHFLVAFDGSDKAREALYVAAYAARAWNSRLTVASVGAPAVARKQLEGARIYLEEQEVAASYVHDSGAVAKVLVTLADENACDLLLLGGFGAHPLRQMLVGSTVLGILRSSAMPILICR